MMGSSWIRSIVGFIIVTNFQNTGFSASWETTCRKLFPPLVSWFFKVKLNESLLTGCCSSIRCFCASQIGSYGTDYLHYLKVKHILFLYCLSGWKIKLVLAVQTFFYTKWANCTKTESRLNVDDLQKCYKACDASEETNRLTFWVKKKKETWPRRLDD